MGLVRDLFSRSPQPTLTLPSTAGSAPQSTPYSTPESNSEQTLLYAIRDAGVVVDLARKPGWAPHPETHALDLLYMLMGDEDFAGQPATEKVIKKYYLNVCRSDGVRPFPWLTVVRHLNRILRAIYGPAYKKTYRNLYVGSSRLKKKRRVYRIPTLEEAAQAKDQPQTAEVVPLRRP